MVRIPAYKAININNFNNIRERSNFPSKISSRSPLISSTTLSIPYYEKMEINNDLPDKEFTEPVNSSQLLYKNNSGEDIPISEATDNSSTRNQQCTSNEAPALKNMPKLQGKIQTAKTLTQVI